MIFAQWIPWRHGLQVAAVDNVTGWSYAWSLYYSSRNLSEGRRYTIVFSTVWVSLLTSGLQADRSASANNCPSNLSHLLDFLVSVDGHRKQCGIDILACALTFALLCFTLYLLTYFAANVISGNPWIVYVCKIVRMPKKSNCESCIWRRWHPRRQKHWNLISIVSNWTKQTGSYPIAIRNWAQWARVPTGRSGK